MRRAPWLALADPIFRGRRVARRLWGFDPSPDGGPLPYDAFDLATLALRRGLSRWLRPGQPVVEVGAGPAAPLTGWLARRGHPVEAFEGHTASAEAARRALRRALGEGAPPVHATAFVRETPLRPDAVVVCNPPYMPTARGRRLGLDPARAHAWDGGPDGLDGYRALRVALAGRACAGLIVGGAAHAHSPGAVQALLGGARRGRCHLGPAWALWLGPLPEGPPVSVSGAAFDGAALNDAALNEAALNEAARG